VNPSQSRRGGEDEIKIPSLTLPGNEPRSPTPKPSQYTDRDTPPLTCTLQNYISSSIFSVDPNRKVLVIQAEQFRKRDLRAVCYDIPIQRSFKECINMHKYVENVYELIEGEQSKAIHILLQISELCPYDMQSEHDGGR